MIVKAIPKGRLWNKIFFLISSSISIVLLIFAPFVYMNVEQSILKLNQLRNEQVMVQMEYNIELMDSSIRDLCISVFLNADATALMYNKKDNMHIFDAIVHMNNITTPYLYVNSYVHSIYLYNGVKDTYYSSYNGIFYRDRILEDYLETHPTPPIYKPIYRQLAKTVNREEILEPVFTYLLYDTILPDGRIEAAAMINVAPQWIMGNLEKANEVGKSVHDFIYLADSSNHIISSSKDATGQYRLSQQDIQPVFDSIHAGSQKGSVEMSLWGEKQYVMYSHIPDVDWTIIKVQPMSSIYESVNTSRTFIVVATGAFVLVSILLALTVSLGIYRPIGNLVNEVAANDMGFLTDHSRDEIKYLQKVFSQAQLPDKNRTAWNENIAIYKNYYFRLLLLNPGGTPKDNSNALVEGNLFTVDFAAGYVLALAKVDGYEQFKRSYTQRECDAIFFAICNVVSEIIGQHCKNEVFDLQENNLVIVASCCEDDCPQTQELLYRSFQKVQEVFCSQFSLSLSFCLGDYACGIQTLPEEYNRLKKLFEYRFISGRGAILTMDFLASRNPDEPSASQLYTVQQGIQSAVRSGNREECTRLIDQLSNLLSCMNIQQIWREILQTTFMIQDGIDSYIQVHPGIEAVNLVMHIDWMQGRESLSELMIYWKDCLGRMFDDNGYSLEKTQLLLAKTVREIVQKNYRNPTLNLAQVADIIHMSPSYVGRVFKLSTNVSVSTYINEIRLEHASALLQDTRLDVGEVMELVGYENESSFYKHFKNKYGITPKQYARNLHNI